MLHAAKQLSDLRALPANRLEALTGSRLGRHSIRINDQWRVCFTWTEEGPADVEIVDRDCPAGSCNAHRCIVKGERSVTADTALRLARFYGTSARDRGNNEHPVTAEPR
jgi:toxin HigB-1